MSVIIRLREFARYLRDARGNVALIFSLLLIPLVGFVGAAVDYQRAEVVQARLQQVLDTIVLRLATEAIGLTDEELLARAQELVDASTPPGANYAIDVTGVTRLEGRIGVAAQTEVPTTLTAVLGFETIGLAITSEAAWGSGILEIALVLDNTLSMASAGKMAALKEAVNVMFDTLEAQLYAEDVVRISIIPFNTEVRIGTSYEGQEWLIIPPDEQPSGYCNWWCQWQWDYYGYGEFDWEDGCVMDRNQPNDANDVPFDPADEDDTGYHPVEECGWSPALTPILPLTDDFDTLRDTIADMEPTGATNITIGMQWGLASLSDHEPLDQALPYGSEDLTKIMIVLTDGLNTANRWIEYEADFWETQAIDARTAAICDEVRAQGIVLYTVRVIDGNEELLEECATENRFYYDVQVAADLVPAFEGIARAISQLRLAD